MRRTNPEDVHLLQLQPMHDYRDNAGRSRGIAIEITRLQIRANWWLDAVIAECRALKARPR